MVHPMTLSSTFVYKGQPLPLLGGRLHCFFSFDTNSLRETDHQNTRLQAVHVQSRLDIPAGPPLTLDEVVKKLPRIGPTTKLFLEPILGGPLEPIPLRLWKPKELESMQRAFAALGAEWMPVRSQILAREGGGSNELAIVNAFAFRERQAFLRVQPVRDILTDRMQGTDEEGISADLKTASLSRELVDRATLNYLLLIRAQLYAYGARRKILKRYRSALSDRALASEHMRTAVLARRAVRLMDWLEAMPTGSEGQRVRIDTFPSWRAGWDLFNVTIKHTDLNQAWQRLGRFLRDRPRQPVDVDAVKTGELMLDGRGEVSTRTLKRLARHGPQLI